MDLTDPRYAYLLGLLQTDGHMWKGLGGKGKLTVELSSKDRDILEKIAPLFPCNSSISQRVRDTNFKRSYASVILRVCDQACRDVVERSGVPYGKKSECIRPPTGDASSVDYYRGLMDGDGSLGVTGNGLPFVSFVTSSDFIASGYMEFMEKVTGLKWTSSRNNRDGVFNIAAFREPAQQLVSAMYYDGCLAMDRKIRLACDVMAWERPECMQRRPWMRERCKRTR